MGHSICLTPLLDCENNSRQSGGEDVASIMTETWPCYSYR